MANKNRSEKSILVNGKRYKLKLTIGALAELEEDIGMVVDDWIINYVKENKHTLKHLLYMFHRALQAGMKDDSIEYSAASDIIQEYATKNGGVQTLAAVCFDLIDLAFSGEKGDEGNE